MHRVTVWYDDDNNPVQCAVACLDSWLDPHAEVTEPVGPFHELEEQLALAKDTAHTLGGWRAHQGTLGI